MHGRLWTVERRRRHGLQQNDCALCDQEPEHSSFLALLLERFGCVFSAALGSLTYAYGVMILSRLVATIVEQGTFAATRRSSWSPGCFGRSATRGHSTTSAQLRRQFCSGSGRWATNGSPPVTGLWRECYCLRTSRSHSPVAKLVASLVQPRRFAVRAGAVCESVFPAFLWHLAIGNVGL